MRTNDRRTDFKAAVKAMFGDKIELAIATTRPNPGRAIIKGLGYAVNNFSDADNVVDINAVKQEKSKLLTGINNFSDAGDTAGISAVNKEKPTTANPEEKPQPLR